MRRSGGAVVKRRMFCFLLLAFVIGCASETHIERKGSVHSEDGETLIQLYAVTGDFDEAALRKAAEAELATLPVDMRVELLFFRDAGLAAMYCEDEAKRQAMMEGFFDASISMSSHGGAVLIRDVDSDPQWNFYSALAHGK